MKKLGFTLIELLVAISIIAILTAFLLPNFMGAREKAQDAQAISDMNAIKNGLRLYYNDKGVYPADLTDVDLPTYIPGIGTLRLNYTYTLLSDDKFRLSYTLITTRGTDDVDSQIKCGIGIPVEGIYMVCAN